ncbi:Hypothetical protein A7982_00915 [Minicystis rosea]|nr:Hypothetical protein A7982_00915 [Minicystis rosea]
MCARHDIMRATDTQLGASEEEDVAIDWGALEDAFESNAGRVRSYLHRSTGAVLRIVDGEGDPHLHARIAHDVSYLRIESVSARVQYAWMEQYIAMVQDPSLKGELGRAIQGRGAFRRFRETLAEHTEARDAWLAFREHLLRAALSSWLEANHVSPATRPSLPASARRRGESAAALRRRLRELTDDLGPIELRALKAFANFMVRRSPARPK